MATSTIYSTRKLNNISSTALNGGSVSQYNYSNANSTPYYGRNIADTSGVKESVNVGKTSDILEFSWNSQRPLVKGYTRTVNTSYNTTGKELGTTGSHSVEFIQSSHPVNSTRTRLVATAIRDGFYNPYNGTFDIGYPDNQLDDFQADNAAITSRNSSANMFFYNGVSTNARAYDKKTG